jgi:hypothetical protein
MPDSLRWSDKGTQHKQTEKDVRRGFDTTTTDYRQPDTPQPYRVETRVVEGHDVVVWTAAPQLADGSLDIDREPPAVHVDIAWERSLTSAQARELAATRGVQNPATSRNFGLTEAMRLLRSVSYGRIVFTRDVLPAVRPVNHIIDDGEVIIRTRVTAKISFCARSVPGVVVAYEANDIDPIRHVGWSVVVTGVARTVTDPQRLARCERLLYPWVPWTP